MWRLDDRDHAVSWSAISLAFAVLLGLILMGSPLACFVIDTDGPSSIPLLPAPWDLMSLIRKGPGINDINAGRNKQH